MLGEWRQEPSVGIGRRGIAGQASRRMQSAGMSNLAPILRAEIVRLARKELRGQVDPEFLAQ